MPIILRCIALYLQIPFNPCMAGYSGYELGFLLQRNPNPAGRTSYYITFPSDSAQVRGWLSFRVKRAAPSILVVFDLSSSI
jgi:hypothetical protein